jgi:hypothetical protein
MRKTSNKKTFFVPNKFIISSRDSLDFLKDLYRELTKEQKKHHEFIIDFSKARNLKIAALMYLLAIVREAQNKFNNRLKIVYVEPIYELAKEQLRISQFPKTRNMSIGHHTTGGNGKDYLPHKGSDNLSSGVIYGDRVNGDFARNVAESLLTYGVKKKVVSDVSTVLVELMGNCVEHGFERGQKTVFTQTWYFYCEESSTSEVLNFIFLDIGSGIPMTAYKNLKETIETRMGAKETQDDIVKTAFEDEGRSRHNSVNRGKGLPQVAELLRGEQFTKIGIYSNKGFTDVTKANILGKGNILKEIFSGYFFKNIGMNFEGTLFYWSLKL